MFDDDDDSVKGGLWGPGAAGFLAETASVIRFFSRLPVPRIGPGDDPLAVPDFSRSARVVPVAGAILALPSALCLLFLSLTFVPPLAQAVVAVIVLICITGALHEDGLADVADGFFGASTPERRLEIMKDSRTGAFGAIALTMGLLLKVVLLGALIERYGATGGVLGLIASEATSRTAMAWLWQALPAARPGGLGALCGTPEAGAVRVAALLAAIICLPLLLLMPFAAIVVALMLLVLTTVFAIRLAAAKIGGQTGDVLGATQQLTAVAFLLGLTSVA
ncbi:adenosylcobinamide-GDP ribazoletransferase [Stappia sp. F7233]|uniref:Adenosylcobinamide-GDP ribazoletransferase n=1 Tax=Stappia albiluteola TaxID=2758565 RepID=A0A839AB08_9HYPH|nr:adenosylcobinamide-GDP ribazoletransferase [Stappia albiluteola]MBA5776591.1 adenosylcobinamide-GDP ribazoletransferase [Stappia albiluteola]